MKSKKIISITLRIIWYYFFLEAIPKYFNLTEPYRFIVFLLAITIFEVISMEIFKKP